MLWIKVALVVLVIYAVGLLVGFAMGAAESLGGRREVVGLLRRRRTHQSD